MDTLPSGCLPAVHQLSSFLGCLRRFQLRARLGSRLSAHPGQRGITPAFGYSAPYPSASGTPTHLIWALPSTHYTPLRHPLAFGPFPGVAGYRTYLAPTLSRRGEEGFSSCLACPCHCAAASTPPQRAGRSNQFATAPCCLRPTVAGSAFGIHFRGHLRVHLRCSPMTRDLP